MSDALREAKRRVALAPDDARARAALGELLLVEGRVEEASEQLERAIALDPGFTAARRSLARAYVAAERATLAERTLVELLRRQPEDLRARCDLAELLERDGRPGEALLQRELVAKGAPDDAANLQEALRLARGLGHGRLALGFGRLLAARTPGDAALQDDVLRLALELGEPDAVVASLRTQPGADERLGTLRAELAMPPLDAEYAKPGLREVAEALRAGDLKRAKRALVLEKTSAAEYVRAALLAIEGKADAAEGVLRGALPGATGALRARFGHALARLALARGDTATAQVQLETLLRETPDDADAAERLGDTLLVAGDRARAEAAYLRATRSHGSPLAHVKLASLRGSAAGARPQVGRVSSLAFSGHGGSTTPVEVVVSDGTGQLALTGNVGKVGREAAEVAARCVRARLAELGIPARSFDAHVHFADLYEHRDGPSAGIAIALALVSALRGVPVPATLAATGELTLHGHVRAVGGLREKLFAAHLDGHTCVIAPRATLFDVRELPPELTRALRVVFVDSLTEAVEAAFTEESA